MTNHIAKLTADLVKRIPPPPGAELQQPLSVVLGPMRPTDPHEAAAVDLELATRTAAAQPAPVDDNPEVSTVTPLELAEIKLAAEKDARANVMAELERRLAELSAVKKELAAATAKIDTLVNELADRPQPQSVPAVAATRKEFMIRRDTTDTALGEHINKGWAIQLMQFAGDYGDSLHVVFVRDVPAAPQPEKAAAATREPVAVIIEPAPDAIRMPTYAEAVRSPRYTAEERIAIANRELLDAGRAAFNRVQRPSPSAFFSRKATS